MMLYWVTWPSEEHSTSRCQVPPESLMLSATQPTHSTVSKPQVHHQSFDQTLQMRTALPAWIMFMPQAWDTALPLVQSSGLQSDWGISPNNSWVMQEAQTSTDWGIWQGNLSFSYPFSPLQGRPRQESPSLVVFKSNSPCYSNSSLVNSEVHPQNLTFSRPPTTNPLYFNHFNTTFGIFILNFLPST